MDNHRLINKNNAKYLQHVSSKCLVFEYLLAQMTAIFDVGSKQNNPMFISDKKCDPVVSYDTMFQINVQI
jgi:hypothetical protein